MIYLIGEEDDSARGRSGGLLKRLQEIEGVEVLAWRDGDQACVWTEQRRAALLTRARLTRDRRGDGWDVDGRLETLELEVARRRRWRAAPTRTRCGGSGPRCGCAGAGDVLVSAARGYEFTDWGGADHAGGGSHGSLRRGDSLATLAFVNCGPDADPSGEWPAQWSITDVAPVVMSHFGQRA